MPRPGRKKHSGDPNPTSEDPATFCNDTSAGVLGKKLGLDVQREAPESTRKADSTRSRVTPTARRRRSAARSPEDVVVRRREASNAPTAARPTIDWSAGHTKLRDRMLASSGAKWPRPNNQSK